MAPYKLLQEQFVALALFGGVVLVTFLFVAFNTIRFVSKKQIKAEYTENYVDGIKSTDKPVPVFLIILYIAYFLWAIIYVGAVALWGFNF